MSPLLFIKEIYEKIFKLFLGNHNAFNVLVGMMYIAITRRGFTCGLMILL